MIAKKTYIHEERFIHTNDIVFFMPITNVAKISVWNEAKGFGFAEANGKKYFVHRSALGPISRSPKVGDTIVVTKFEETPKGPRITSGVLEGVPLKQFHEKRTAYTPGYYRKRKLKYALAIFLIAIPMMLFAYCQEHSFSQKPTPSAVVPTPQNADRGTESRFHCDGRTHCSQMNSYEEALFFLKNCPETQMDGDGDGIPCERQFGR